MSEVLKPVQIGFYRRIAVSDSPWKDTSDWAAVAREIETLKRELLPLGFRLETVEEATEICVRGYGDLLNSIRLRYPPHGFANACLGHVIGCSAKLDLAADIRRGINRLLFAPETIEPLGSDKVVCHNCGCGC